MLGRTEPPGIALEQKTQLTRETPYSILRDLPARARREKRPKTGQAELRARLDRTIEQLLNLASAAAVSRALSAPTGFDSLSLLLDKHLQEHPEVAAVDSEVVSHLRLVEARRELLERAGGTYDSTEAAAILDITPEAVRKRIQRGLLLSYRTPSREYRLPRAQFSDSGVLDGVEEVLQAMHVDDPWMRIQLFLDRDVVGALKEGRVADAVRAAQSYLPADEIEE